MTKITFTFAGCSGTIEISGRDRIVVWGGMRQHLATLRGGIRSKVMSELSKAGKLL